MKWQNILKDNRTEIISMLEEGIPPGYSVRLEERTFDNRLYVVVSKFPQLQNKEFDLTNLNLEIWSLPRIDETSNWSRLVAPVKAGIVALDLFLREVDKNNDFDKIDEDNYFMTLSNDRLKIEFTLSRACDSKMMDPEGDSVANMCLSYGANDKIPATGDSWLSIYMVARILLNNPIDVISDMAQKNMIPDVLENAVRAIVHDDYLFKCESCESYIEDDTQCEECGYYLTVNNEDEITVHEGSSAFVSAYPTGWDCPYNHPDGNDFIHYGDRCEIHGARASDYGPYHGYDNDGDYLDEIEAYLFNGNIIPEGAGDLITMADALNHYEPKSLISDLTEYYLIDKLAEMMNFTVEYLDNQNWKVVIGDKTYIWDDAELTEYDEEE